MNRTLNLAAFMAMGVVTICASASAETISIRRNDVIPIRFTEELNLRNTREGDRVWAVSDSERDLPGGTILEGKVLRIERTSGSQRHAIAIEFNSIEFPDRTRHPIRAIPISLDGKYVRRDTGGRYVIKTKEADPQKWVVGGAIGGLILGNSIKKPFEGAFLGTLLGMAAAEIERREAGKQIFVKKNARMGAWFESDARLQFENKWEARITTRRIDGERLPDRTGDRGDPGKDNRSGGRYDDRGESRRTEEPEVRYDDRVIRFGEAKPYWEGRVCMVPLFEIAQELNLSAERTGSERILVEGEDATLILELRTQDYRLNGRRMTLPATVSERDGVVYVPVDVLARVAEKPIAINGTKIDKKA